VEVEVDTLAQLDEALEARADIILLDNFTVPRLRLAMGRLRKARLAGLRVLAEASGGVTLKTVRAMAAAGVDRISVGALTHSAPAVDLSLEFL
jgi:nicotinate-nucleotide pyrophosphorylase (carboxylating)